ncbi:ribosomal protein mS34 [Acrasis kona]|uniref:Ribosomal protein mS34 n=1 Tax=Acrasis kona TaxID=1008807 RepID=A0AAW2ZG62_9EUKA
MSFQPRLGQLTQTPLTIIDKAVRIVKRKEAKKKNLYDILQVLPRFGEGYMFRRTKWTAPDTYIILHKVNLARDGRHGKIFAIKYYCGQPVRDGRPFVLKSALKSGWRYIREETAKEREEFKQVEDFRKSILEKIRAGATQRQGDVGQTTQLEENEEVVEKLKTLKV